MLELDLEADGNSQVVLIPTDCGFLITILNTLLVAEQFSNLLKRLKI